MGLVGLGNLGLEDAGSGDAAWRLSYKSLKILVRNFSANLALKNDLNLGGSLCIFTFFLFRDSGLYLLNGFDLYFN